MKKLARCMLYLSRVTKSLDGLTITIETVRKPMKDINMKQDKTMCCDDCGSDDIEWRVWADENNNVSRTCEDRFIYCNDCEDNKNWTNK